MSRRITVAVCVVGILSLWVLDAAVFIPEIGNGFWDMNSSKTFHVALWIAIGCFVAILLKS